MFAAVLAATFVLRPVRDQFGVDVGVAGLGYLYSLTVLATIAVLPGFWWLANRTSSRRFVPVVLQCCSLAALLLGAALLLVGDYDWSAPGARRVGEVFWGAFSAVNVVLPSLVWIHAVEHFGRDQGMRLFGLVGVGGTLGAVVGSQLSQWMSEGGVSPAGLAVVSCLTLQVAFFGYLASVAACRRMVADSGGPSEPASATAGGGMFAGVRLLLQHQQLRRIACYMGLFGMVATAFYAVQTELVGRHVQGGSAQAALLGEVEKYGQGLVLLMQLFVTGRMLPRLHPALFLCLLPLLSICGLLTLWTWPVVVVLFVVQVLRRASLYALEKPSREVLFTTLPLEAKYKSKIVVDTFALRFGDLLGAWLQVGLFQLGLGVALVLTVGIAVLWLLLAARIGIKAAVGRSPG